MAIGADEVVEGLAQSAFAPGVVIGTVDDGLTNYVRNLDDVARGEVAGYNSRVIGTNRMLFPRISRADFQQLELQRLPEVPHVLEDMLGGMVGMPAAVAHEYTSTRKVVRQDMGDGSQRLIIVPRIPEAADEIDILDREDLEAEQDLARAYSGDVTGRRKSRKYTLAQLFTDGDVLPKYNLSVRLVETAKRIAVTDPHAAAALYQTAMNQSQSDIAVTVSAGNFSTNRAQACNAIKQMCRYAPRTDVVVASLVMHDEIYMFGPGGEKDWHVRGPLKYATEVCYLYWFIRHEGIIFPNILLSMEIVVLGLNVGDAMSEEAPRVEYHSALPGSPVNVGVPMEITSRLTVNERLLLEGAGKRLMPILGFDGSQIATAIRVTGKYVLVNSHVIEADSACTIGGERVVAKSQISRDLWAAKNEGDAEPWRLRDPVIGETVVICYIAEGRLSCSSQVKVVSVDEACVVTTLDSGVSYGTSGGALVSLTDGALLGVHSASTRANLISYRFGDREFVGLMDSDSATTFSRQDDVESFAAKTVEHFEKRGLGRILAAAADSMEPVFIGDTHVGMLASAGDGGYTACDPTAPLRVGELREAVVFEKVPGTGLYRVPDRGSKMSTPVYTRSPNYYERVFIIGYDTDSYISQETTIVHVGVGGKSFTIGELPGVDKPVEGGLVMAWDGAVLGCCGPRSVTNTGMVGHVCWALPRWENPDVQDPRGVLARIFPMLNMSAWPDDLLEEVFTHSSVGHYKDKRRKFNAGARPLANVGDNVAKAELYKSLREALVPHSEWSAYMQSLQSNASFALVATKLGYAELLQVGNGVAFQHTSKAYADVTEAFVGAVYLVEKPETVTEVCRALGIVYDKDKYNSHDTPKASSFGFS